MATAAVTNSFASGTLIESAEANTNFQDLVTFLNNQTIHVDASKVFTAVPSGPAADPVSDNQFTRKKYVDSPYIRATAVTAVIGPGAALAVVPSGGANWTLDFSRGTWTRNTGGFLLLETGVYIAGFTAFSSLSAFANISALMRSNAVSVGTDMGTWTGNQPTSTLSGAGIIHGTAGHQVDLQFTVESGTATVTATLWAYKIPGST